MVIGKKIFENEKFLKSLCSDIISTSIELLTLVEVCMNVLKSKIKLNKNERQKIIRY